METEIPTQAKFALAKGERDTDRLIMDCYKLIAEALKTNPNIKVFEPSERGLMFDITKLTEKYDHIEFTITKTGWGGSL